MFGSKYEMPPVADFEKGDENEYRCPYIPSCPAGANCFAVATPEPLQEKEILNVTCRLCGNRKIPIYAGKARRGKNRISESLVDHLDAFYRAQCHRAFCTLNSENAI